MFKLSLRVAVFSGTSEAHAAFVASSEDISKVVIVVSPMSWNLCVQSFLLFCVISS